MSLFGRKKKQDKQARDVDPTTDEGIIGLYHSIIGRVEEDFTQATVAHLERLHEPGGYAREKKEADFMDLGMPRSYIKGMDDIEFTVQESISLPMLGMKRRGGAVIVTRWTARGTHSRPIAGVAPSGAQATIEGLTYTTFRNFDLRLEYTYWQMPELTRRMAER